MIRSVRHPISRPHAPSLKHSNTSQTQKHNQTLTQPVSRPVPHWNRVPHSVCPSVGPRAARGQPLALHLRVSVPHISLRPPQAFAASGFPVVSLRQSAGGPTQTHLTRWCAVGRFREATQRRWSDESVRQLGTTALRTRRVSVAPARATARPPGLQFPEGAASPAPPTPGARGHAGSCSPARYVGRGDSGRDFVGQWWRCVDDPAGGCAGGGTVHGAWGVRGVRR